MSYKSPFNELGYFVKTKGVKMRRIYACDWNRRIYIDSAILWQRRIKPCISMALFNGDLSSSIVHAVNTVQIMSRSNTKVKVNIAWPDYCKPNSIFRKIVSHLVRLKNQF